MPNCPHEIVNKGHYWPTFAITVTASGQIIETITCIQTSLAITYS
jgi:hypothetical protein